MKTCRTCSKNTTNKVYCSRICAEKSKYGRKRPDLVLRNKTNNPIWDDEARKKMSVSLTGKKHTIETIEKRKNSIVKARISDSTLSFRQSRAIVELNINKPKGWKRMRQLALDRDKGICQSCLTEGKRVIVHHKDHNGRNLNSLKLMNNELNNLITLCYGCHLSLHTWTVRRGEEPKLL